MVLCVIGGKLLCSLEFPFQGGGGACHSPPSPSGISVIIQFGWVPSERILVSNMLVHYTIMRKIMLTAIKLEKIFSFMLIG